MTTQEWIDSGRSRAELRTGLANGRLVRIRRGVIMDSDLADALAVHRMKLSAVAPALGPSTYFAHESAAVVHCIPLLFGRLDDVVVVRTGGGHGVITPTLHARRACLAPEDVAVVDGLPTTSLARTVADLTRRLPFPEAVMVVDAGLRRGLDRGDLLRRTAAGRGCRMASRCIQFADPRAESAGESMSRVRMHQAGLPMPEIQHEVFDDDGQFVARLDFWWEEHGLAGEFDGMGKYTTLLGSGGSTEQVLLAEKRREQRLFDLGIRVLRWTWNDLSSPQLGLRLWAALGRPSPPSRAILRAESPTLGSSPRREGWPSARAIAVGAVDRGSPSAEPVDS